MARRFAARSTVTNAGAFLVGCSSTATCRPHWTSAGGSCFDHFFFNFFFLHNCTRLTAPPFAFCTLQLYLRVSAGRWPGHILAPGAKGGQRRRCGGPPHLAFPWPCPHFFIINFWRCRHPPNWVADKGNFFHTCPFFLSVLYCFWVFLVVSWIDKIVRCISKKI